MRYICSMHSSCRHTRFLLLVMLCVSAATYAGEDTAFIRQQLRKHINALASPAMRGRGYIEDGRERAALYIERQFRTPGLEPPGEKGYRQSYSFPVNTFPGPLQLVVNGRELVPGADYLVDAGSSSLHAKNLTVCTVDLSAGSSSAAVLGLNSAGKLWVLNGADSFCKARGVPSHALAAALPAGAFLIPQKSKAMWTVSRKQQQATVFYVSDTLIPQSGNAAISVRARLKEMRSDNIVACVPGAVKDSFIVFSAHYDHLGMMGDKTIFPGASDNASGTAMLLYLAAYYATHPQRYTMVFIAFSGEEAGLMGSEWFVAHPVFPLSHIKFLTNLDIMGDATDGITVVNATELPQQFAQLDSINRARHYLPVIKSRGKAANSDHYHFSEAGVPAFFIYTNGGKGYYHDVYDKPAEVTFANVPSLALLLCDFVAALHGH